MRSKATTMAPVTVNQNNIISSSSHSFPTVRKSLSKTHSLPYNTKNLACWFHTSENISSGSPD